MTTDEFKKLYIQHGKNSTAASIVFMIIGLGGAITTLILDMNIYATCALGGLGLVAIFAFMKNRQHKASIENGTNPLLKGIEEGNSDYVKWFYITVLTKKENNVPIGKRYYIDAYNHKRLILEWELEDAAESDAVMKLLAEKFPHAQQGYTDEIRQKMKDQYGYKFHNQKYEEPT